jgi:uncharacterized phosphatase
MKNYRFICLIRHGETDWNKEKRIQGQEDIPLNENGYLQAKSCGEALKTANWCGTEIISSPLSRAMETAKKIGEVLKITDIGCEKELIERDYGNASGTRKMAKGRQIEFPKDRFQHVEPWEDLSRRMYQCVLRIAKEHTGDTIVVSHGAAISALLSWISNGRINPAQHVLKNTSISILLYKESSLYLKMYDMQDTGLRRMNFKDRHLTVE